MDIRHKEWLPVLGYAAVAFFCGLCGLLLSYFSVPNTGAAGLSRFPHHLNPYRLEIAYFYIIGLIFFLLARAYTVDAHKDIDTSDRLKLINWLAIGLTSLCYIFPLLRDAPSGWIEWLIYPASSVLAFLFILIRTNSIDYDVDNGIEERSLCFTNRIFFPAMATCITSFLVGWFIVDVNPYSWVVLPIVSVSLCFLMYFSGKGDGSSKRSILIFVGILILVPVIQNIFTDTAAVVGLPISIFIAFALGVTEVANRNYHIHKEDSNYRLSRHEQGEYYSAGANWSAFVFIPIVPSLALFLPVLPVWVLFAYALVFILTWALTKNKVTLRFRIIALALGLALPLTILGGVLIGNFAPDWILLFDGPVSQTDGSIRHVNGDLSNRIATILGVLLAIMFVLLHSKYQEFMRTFKKSNTFLSTRNCMLLFFLIMSLVSVYALFVTGVLDRFSSSEDTGWRKIDEFQVWSLILIAVILVVYMWGGEDGEDSADVIGHGGGNGHGSGGAVDAAEERDSLPATAFARTNGFGRIARYIVIGRGTTSLVAGAATSGVLLFHHGDVSWGVVAAGAAILLITMFGFVENDISDRDKDRLGGRDDKLLVSGGLGVREAKGVALALVSCSWLVACFAFGAEALAFLAVLAIALSVYSAFSRRLPICKGLYTACLCMSPSLFVNIVAGTEVVSPYIVAFGIIFFVGRELAIDSKDEGADKLAGMKTLAVILGPRFGRLFGWIAMAAAFLILALAVRNEARLLAAAGLALLIGLGLYSSVNPARAIRLSRVALLFGVFSVGISL